MHWVQHILELRGLDMTCHVTTPRMCSLSTPMSSLPFPAILPVYRRSNMHLHPSVPTTSLARLMGQPMERWWMEVQMVHQVVLWMARQMDPRPHRTTPPHVKTPHRRTPVIRETANYLLQEMSDAQLPVNHHIQSTVYCTVHSEVIMWDFVIMFVMGVWVLSH